MEKNAGGDAIPANYFRFLEHIREHRLVLWMDWMANVGVNVPVPETIAYMGRLYAECIVLEGREADIWLCVPGAEPFATDAQGLTFILITQPRDDAVAFTPSEKASVKGHRVISLWVGEENRLNLDLHAKPPMAKLRFYDCLLYTSPSPRDRG